MKQRTVTVVIKADTQEFRRELARLRLALERSWFRRLRLRLEIARIR